MPEQDYKKLLGLALVSTEAVAVLTSGDPKKIDELLTYPIFGFTHEEMEFLAGVKADDLKDFVNKTSGYWKD